MKDNEYVGFGNFGDRGVQTQTGRWPTPDKLAQKYPSESPYLFGGDNPIYFIDKGGMYKVSANNEANYNRDYPLIMKYLSTQVEHDISNSTKIINGLIATNPNIQESTINGISKWKSGPEIQFKEAPGEFPLEFKGAASYTEKDDHVIQMNAGYATFIENVLKSNASDDTKQAAFTRFYMTLIHETSHDLNKNGAPSGHNVQGNVT